MISLLHFDEWDKSRRAHGQVFLGRDRYQFIPSDALHFLVEAGRHSADSVNPRLAYEQVRDHWDVNNNKEDFKSARPNQNLKTYLPESRYFSAVEGRYFSAVEGAHHHAIRKNWGVLSPNSS